MQRKNHKKDSNTSDNSGGKTTRKETKPGDNDVVFVLEQTVNLAKALVEDLAGTFLFPVGIKTTQKQKAKMS